MHLPPFSPLLPVLGTATMRSLTSLSLHGCSSYAQISCHPLLSKSSHCNFVKLYDSLCVKRTSCRNTRVLVSGNVRMENSAPAQVVNDEPPSQSSLDNVMKAQWSSDWKVARDCLQSGHICKGTVESFNTGGLLVGFNYITGFLPYSQLSTAHICQDPHAHFLEIAERLVGLVISFKIIRADEESRKLILSEKAAAWSLYSDKINVGDILQAKVLSVMDYGAFVGLRFPDGLYHLNGLVHLSEVSWDYVRDVRDFFTKGDEVRVKVIGVDRKKMRITVSMKQLEDDPLLETLDKVIPPDGSDGSNYTSTSAGGSGYIEPLPGLEAILDELLKEDGIDAVKINRQGFEKRVVSQDLQLWLSNAPLVNGKFTLLARAGRQVQEIQLSTSFDQEGIKKAIQRVLERVP